MEGKKQDYFEKNDNTNISLFSIQNTFKNFSFYVYFNTLRILSIREPFFLGILENFLNFVSIKTLKLFIKSIAEKEIITLQRENFSRIFLNLNFKEHFIQTFYRKNILFPEVRKNFQKNKTYFFKKQKYNFFAYNLKKKKNILNFLKGNIKKGETQPSIQFILCLKSSDLVDYSWKPKGLKIKKNGMHLLFYNFENQFVDLINFLKGNIFPYFLKKFYTWRGCYMIMQKISCIKNYFKKQKTKNKNTIVEEIWNRLIKKRRIQENLFHGFFEDCFNYILFFQEFKVLFFPCMTDKIFYIYPFFFQNQKREKTKVIENHHLINFQDQKYQIIIESNFRIYVYKNAHLGNDLLLVFSEILYQLPNLFVGEITEKSILKAFNSGSTSRNIIGFLKNNLHPICPWIPSAVTNQIKAWEFQKTEIKITESLMILNSGDQKHLEKTKKLIKWKKNKKTNKTDISVILEKFF
ncbi:tfIIB-like protein (nucleomorph) [Chroomonas mesostigmatica CCMP1168]|uniref:General transcription factor IIH subunit 4 n=1 Tax=Chroomonas mesostigmatica CCMP1168 TaxID=1195612 RepID=J7G2T9_9CRYP|nr:tfIIB-like protein [Chroomonas mesostigmatica CCMP1168]